jgi:hypothetical protein
MDSNMSNIDFFIDVINNYHNYISHITYEIDGNELFSIYPNTVSKPKKFFEKVFPKEKIPNYYISYPVIAEHISTLNKNPYRYLEKLGLLVDTKPARAIPFTGASASGGGKRITKNKTKNKHKFKKTKTRKNNNKFKRN